MPLNSATLLRAVLGYLLGYGLWLGAYPAWERLTVAPAEAVIRAVESPVVTRLRSNGDGGVIVDRSDFPRRSGRPTVDFQGITYNVMLLTALFATSPRPLSGRNLGGLLLAGAVLWFIHGFTLVANVQAIYALALGAWSEARYGPVSRNFWAGYQHFYRILGVFAFPIAAWWLFRDAGTEGKTRGAGNRNNRRRRKR